MNLYTLSTLGLFRLTSGLLHVWFRLVWPSMRNVFTQVVTGRNENMP